MTDITLLPCPFCGGHASIVDAGGVRAVECDECCASINDDPEYAAAAWNRRVAAPAPSDREGVVEALHRIVAAYNREVFLRTADVHSAGCLRCAIDNAEDALRKMGAER